MTRVPASAAFAAILLAPACTGEREDVRPALDAFERFQDALLRGDREALSHMVTRESRQVVPELPLEAAAGKRPLQVVGAARDGYRVHVHVTDPNDGGSQSRFIVARESGKWVLDLVETAAYNHVRVESGDYTLKPRPITPSEIEGIRSRHPEVIR